MRTVAYNVYGCTGWPDDVAAERWGGSGGDRVLNRLVTEIESSVSPDVLTLSEAPRPDLVQKLANGLGMSVQTFPSRGNWPGALLTTGQIREAETLASRLNGPPSSLFTRHAGRAVVSVDGSDLVVYSAHFHPSESDTRKHEIDRFRSALVSDVESGQPVILQGDLNHKPDQPEYEIWRDTGLRDAFAVMGSPKPTIKADNPDRRLDYVWVSESLRDRLEAARVVDDPPFGAGADRSNADGPFLSDHLPVAVDINIE